MLQPRLLPAPCVHGPVPVGKTWAGLRMRFRGGKAPGKGRIRSPVGGWQGRLQALLAGNAGLRFLALESGCSIPVPSPVSRPARAVSRELEPSLREQQHQRHPVPINTRSRAVAVGH